MVEFYLILNVVFVVITSLFTILGNKLRVAPPILLVVFGILLSFIPNIKHIEISPELIFYVFLPPLLYEAAWAVSWKELWKWRRIISSFAFVVVFLTAIVVAFFANQIIPSFPLVLGFLLGGIVSPPNAVSASAITKFVKIPKRLSVLLEGESLFNDASSLVIVRFALLVMTTGEFMWHHAVLEFIWMIVGGIAVGILVALCFIFTYKKLPTTSEIDVVLTLIVSYIMYILAEMIEASGVMSVMCGGLFIVYRGVKIVSA